MIDETTLNDRRKDTHENCAVNMNDEGVGKSNSKLAPSLSSNFFSTTGDPCSGTDWAHNHLLFVLYRLVQRIRPSCSVVLVKSNLSCGSCTRDKQGSTATRARGQRTRAVLTSLRHPLLSWVPAPGLGTPGRGFTACASAFLILTVLLA